MFKKRLDKVLKAVYYCKYRTKLNKVELFKEEGKMYCQLFHPKLVQLSIKGRTQEEIFTYVAKQLTEAEMVTDDYLAAVQEREMLFPTGLLTQNLTIALPHTDPEYVKKPFVFIARSNQAVPFYQMGDGRELLVNNYFFLGITDAKAQVGLLQAFMTLFMNDQFVEQYKKCQQERDAYQLFYDTI